MWPLKRAPKAPDPAWDRGEPDGWLEQPGEEPQPIYLNDGIRPDLAIDTDVSDKDAVAMLLAARRGPEEPLYFDGLDLAEERDDYGHRAQHEVYLAQEEARLRMATLKPWQVKALSWLDRAHATLERGVIKIK